MADMTLAGDIGGTKTRLAFFEADGPHLRLSAEADYRSRDYADLAALLRDFLQAHSLRPALVWDRLPPPFGSDDAGRHVFQGRHR